MSKRALITGITGQDGSYLAEFLLGHGYEVHGIIRRSSTFNTDRIDHLVGKPGVPLVLHHGDLGDASSLRRILELALPDEIYNLAAQSHVKVSFEEPEYTADVAATGTLRLLESLRDYITHTRRKPRFYQAGSSEMYGSSPAPQSERTPFFPRSPYAIGKLAAHYFTINYREAYGVFAVNGILFNHESPRRGETFVTRKITRAATRIKLGLQERLTLGNLDAIRDWGFAGDYVEAMWLMLQRDTPGDYVVGTGEGHTVREFLDVAFGGLGLDWNAHVDIDPHYFRPTEVDHLCADPSHARETLGWHARVGFKDLVEMMVRADLGLAEKQLALVNAGHDPTVRGYGHG